MSADRLQELFELALDQKPDQLAAFLVRECGQDAALLRDLRELLAADQAAQEESIWQRNAINGDIPAERDIQDRCGQRIGPYRITEIIGVGGMGSVYRALREDSEYRQLVAIKFVKRGMDTDSIVQRFRNERQILANLEHPGIARLLDGGTTPEGLPYLVMEFIDGKPLNEYCRSGCSIHDRLKLFCAICSAVQYAHRHLVIHRDLKPSNILVTADGVPKLLDFGIARILSPEPGHMLAETLNVKERQLTPGYASPEQINGQSITTASDIYSLGVILYEMLTGQSPYGKEKRTAVELMQAVCQNQPVKPSSRSKELKGDLDNIVLMALRKEPERRYASVEQFSEDVNRFLELRPVRARGDKFSYVALRFVRRNWLATCAVAMIALILVAGIVATARAQARAERRFNDVRQLAHSFVFDYYDAIETLPGATPVRQRLVKEALRYLDSLSNEADSVSLERELLQAYVKISRVQGNTYESNLGDAPGALTSAQKAISIGNELVKRDHGSETLGALGAAYLEQAELLHGSNQLQAAERAYDSALQITQSAIELNPGDADLTLQLIRTERHLGELNGADGNANLGRTARAAEFYQRAAGAAERLLKEHPKLPAAERDLFDNYVAMAALAATTGHRDQAIDGYRKALSMIRAISSVNPNNADDRMEIAGTSIRLAREFVAASKPQQALPYFKEAAGIVESLCRLDPQNSLYQRNLSVTEVHIGNALMKEGDARGAIGYFSKASALSARLSAASHGSVEFLGDLALAERKLGQAFLDLGNNQMAALHAAKSLGILQGLTSQSADANLMASVARSQELAGDIEVKRKSTAMAASYFEKARNNFADLARTDPANMTVRGELVESERKLAECCSKRKR